MSCTTAAQIRQAKKQNKICALMGIEGGYAIENSLHALRNFYRLGIRYKIVFAQSGAMGGSEDFWVRMAIAGSQASALAAMLPDSPRVLELLPDAGEVRLLGDAVLTDTIAPIYGRGPDARDACLRPLRVDVGVRGCVLARLRPGRVLLLFVRGHGGSPLWGPAMLDRLARRRREAGR